MEPTTHPLNNLNEQAQSTSGLIPFRYWFGPAFIILFVSIFLAVKLWFGDVQAIHFLFSFTVLSLYFFNKQTRTLIVISIPVMVYAFIYDFFRYIPFDLLLPIHIKDVYDWDLFLFGMQFGGEKIPFHHFILEKFSHVGFDIYTGIIYFLHIPAFILAIFLFWRLGSIDLAQRYTAGFLIMNLFTFLTYFFLPAAAPWYVEKYGFIQPLGPLAGDAAGLVKFEQLLGLTFLSDNYSLGPVTFGAIPSMHVGFATIIWLYSFQLSRKWAVFLGAFVASMVFSALYLQHHYFIDLVWGGVYAVLSWALAEKIFFKKIKRGNRFLWKVFFQNTPRPLFK